MHIKEAWIGRDKLWNYEPGSSINRSLVAHFNPAHSHISLPADIYHLTMTHILNDLPVADKVECANFTCSIALPCESISLPSFRIQLSSVWGDNIGTEFME
jgi:hypothetical protein